MATRDVLIQKKLRNEQVLQVHNRIQYLQQEEQKKLKKINEMQYKAE